MTTTTPVRESQPAIEEPKITAATPQRLLRPAASKKGKFGVVTILAAVLALLVGIGVGYAIALPGSNDLAEQRDAARTSLAAAQATVRSHTAQDLIKGIPTQQYLKINLNTQGSRWQNEGADYRTVVVGEVAAGLRTQNYLKLHLDTQGSRWQDEGVDYRTFVPGDVTAGLPTQKYLKLHLNTQGSRWQAESADRRS